MAVAYNLVVVFWVVPFAAALAIAAFVLSPVLGRTPRDILGTGRDLTMNTSAGYAVRLAGEAINLVVALIVTRRFSGERRWGPLLRRLGLHWPPPAAALLWALALGAALPAIGFAVAEALVVHGRLPSSAILPCAGVVVGEAARLLLSVAIEEVVFRGYVLQVVAREWGLAVGVVVSSVLFSLTHFITEAFTVPRALLIFFIGISLGYCFARTGSLWVSIALHYGWDLTAAWLNAWWTIVGHANSQAAQSDVQAFWSTIALFVVVGVGILLVRLTMGRANAPLPGLHPDSLDGRPA